MSNISVYREAILEEALKFIGGTAVAIGIVVPQSMDGGMGNNERPSSSSPAGAPG